MNKISSIYKNLSLPLKVTFWFFISSLFQKGLSFITTPIFTRLLSSSDYGIVSVYNSWEQIIVIFLTMGLANSVINVGMVKYESNHDRFLSSMIGLELVYFFVSSAAFLLFSFFIYNFTKLDFRYLVAMALFSFFNTIQGIWILKQRFQYKYIKMTILTIINAVLSIILSLLLVINGDDRPFNRILGGVVVLSAIGLYCLYDLISTEPHLYNLEYWKFALKYNLPMIPHFLASVILNQLDRIMIRDMCGLSQAGIYSVSYNCAFIVYIFNQALSASYNPWLLQRLKCKKYDGIKTITNSILIVYLALVLVIILFAPEIMKIMATKEYYEGIYVIPPVACSMFFILLFNIFSPVEHFSLKTRFIGIASSISAVANIILNYLCINKFGYYAAGYTTLICYIIYALAHWIYMKKSCKEMNIEVLFDDNQILAMSLIAVCFCALCNFMYSFVLLRYAFIGIIIIFLIVERKKVINIFRNITNR